MVWRSFNIRPCFSMSFGLFFANIVFIEEECQSNKQGDFRMDSLIV